MVPFSGPYAASDESLAHVSQVNIENESTVTAAHDSFYEGENSCNDFDIGLIDKSNRIETELVLRLEEFKIPEPGSFPVDKYNHPALLFTITLTSGEKCKRDWLRWSSTNKSVYCVPCFLLSTDDHCGISAFAKHPGWDIHKTWRKLKDKIPEHEKSISHENNCIA